MVNNVAKEDVFDADFVDAEELASDGYYVYRSVLLASTTSATRNIVIEQNDNLDILTNVDDPLQIGDIIQITGNAAVGRYTVELIVSDSTFRVVESIVDSVDGYADFIHPAGATKIGVYNGDLLHSTSTNLQDVLEDIDGSITQANPSQIGQLMYSADGVTFAAELPLTSQEGWLVNDDGILLII